MTSPSTDAVRRAACCGKRWGGVERDVRRLQRVGGGVGWVGWENTSVGCELKEQTTVLWAWVRLMIFASTLFGIREGTHDDAVRREKDRGVRVGANQVPDAELAVLGAAVDIGVVVAEGAVHLVVLVLVALVVAQQLPRVFVKQASGRKAGGEGLSRADVARGHPTQ